MRRRGKTFLSLLLSAVIVTGQPVLADFSAERKHLFRKSQSRKRMYWKLQLFSRILRIQTVK